jgi:hypothetical protein
MTERITAWQCIGCGRIEGAQPCVGICEDRKAEFVHASDYDATLAQLALAGRQVERLTAVLRQIAYTSPKKGECERTWMALQQRACRVLDGPADGGEGGADRASATPRPAPARASASAKAPRRAPRPRGTRR